jgi:hypothetical protein
MYYKGSQASTTIVGIPKPVLPAPANFLGKVHPDLNKILCWDG